MTSLVSKFVLTLFIARYMGFEDLGFYGLIVSATFVVPAITGLGIMYMKTREAVTQEPADIVQNLYYYGRYILVVYSLIFILSSLVGYQINHVELTCLIVATILVEHLNNDLYFLLLNLSKPLAANILHFIRTTVWICSFIAMFFFYPEFQTIENVMLFWFAGSFIAFLGFVFVMRSWPWRQIPKFPSFVSWMKKEVVASKVGYINNVVISFSHYIGHFMVSIFLGLELTGVYVYFMQVINAMSNLLRTGVIQTTRPKLINARKSKESSFNKIYFTCKKNTVFFSVLMSVVSIPVMYFITLYVVDKPLALEWFLVLCLNLVFFIGLMLVETDNLILYSYHRDDLLLKLNILGVSSLALLGGGLILFFSLWGASLAMLFMVGIQFFVQRRYIKEFLS